jgi:shikimate 5-dehydrogenase
LTNYFHSCVIRPQAKIQVKISEIGATNTIVNEDNVLTAYNTDVYSSYTLIKKFREETGLNDLVVLGRGGYSKAVKYSGEKLKMNISQITRENWEDIRFQKDKIIFNCTPVKNLDNLVDPSSHFIDCNTDTETGSTLARLQGEKQFELYTGISLK